MVSLKKLPNEDVMLLIKSIEKKNSQDSLHALCFLKQVIEWNHQEEVEYSVYSPDGDYSDDTFLLTLVLEKGVYATYYSCSEVGCLRLKEALEHSDVISGNTPCILTSIDDKVDQIVGVRWRTWLAGPYQHFQRCHNYMITPQQVQALDIKCPDDVYVRDLTEEDAELVNSQWPHRNSRSLELIRNVIRTSLSVGLCSKRTGHLLSWALKWYYGGIGVLQTLEHAKRRGYGRVVVATLAKKMNDLGWPVQLVIIDGNQESIPLVTKLGFRRTNKCYWFYFNVFDWPPPHRANL